MHEKEELPDISIKEKTDPPKTDLLKSKLFSTESKPKTIEKSSANKYGSNNQRYLIKLDEKLTNQSIDILLGYSRWIDNFSIDFF